MSDDYKMSPLAAILMSVLSKATWVAGGLLVLFAGILLYQRRTPDGFVFEKGDIGFLVVLGLMMLLAIYLVRSITKEMKKPGG
jgi:hypothetical protein